MTVLFDDGSSTPGVHVLLVGVGRYPYLRGGDAPKSFAHHENMGQLDSPPVSVAALADWFRRHADEPTAPLRSMQVLCSAGEPLTLPAFTAAGTAPVAIDPADLDHVEEAVAGWVERCERNEENLLLLYFCGHGIASGQEQSLLLQDFGRRAHHPFRDAIAFSQLRAGLRARKVRNQCLLVDACRGFSPALLRRYGADYAGSPLVAAGVTEAVRGTRSQVFRAAELGTAAYGMRGRPTLFAQGLLAALDGSASWQHDDGTWRVTTARLADAINAHAAELALLDAIPSQFCDPEGVVEGIVLHALQGEPNVPVHVRCEPDDATALADFACRLGDRDLDHGTCGDLPVWTTRLAPDRYDFVASFPPDEAGYRQGLVQRRSVVPPLARVSIRVLP